MGRKIRGVRAHSFYHTYQRAASRSVIYYSVADRLVHLTIISTMARKYGIKISAIAFMFDHLHKQVYIDDPLAFKKFENESTSLFVREYNEDTGRTGRLWDRLGKAPKKGPKKTKTNINYIANNPVERKLCKRVEDTRWNLLAYYKTSHPFSSKIALSTASRHMRRAVAEVKSFHQKNKWLNYKELHRLFDGLRTIERGQLTDYIIYLYNPLDFDLLTSLYGNYDTMLVAMNSNTGNEYDLDEEFSPWPDTAYVEMINVISKLRPGRPVKEVLRLSTTEKLELSRLLLEMTSASEEQIQKMLWKMDGIANDRGGFSLGL